MIVALATALVHFSWQGLLLGLVVWMLRPALRRTEASVRHVLLFGLLLLAPLLFASTFIVLLGLPSPSGHALLPARSSSPTWAQVVTAAWAAGVGTLALRTAIELTHLVRLRATGLPLRAWHEPLERLRARLGLRGRVALAESPVVGVPLVTGWLRPMILLPLGLAARMPPAWIESILAHELAHVRRHDVLLGIVQRAVEVLLFFHPIVWWLSSEIRRAREEACDDLVVDALESPIEYARALTELAASDPITPALAMGLEQGSLMSRIRHIVDRSPRPLRPPRHLPAVGVALALGVVAGLGCLTQLAGNDEQVHASAEPDTEHTLDVEVTAEGYRVDGQALDLEEIGVLLEQLREADPYAAVHLHAAEDVRAEQVAAVLETAKTRGIRRLGIVDRPFEASSSRDPGQTAAGDGLSIAWLPERVVGFEPQILAAAERHGLDANLVAILVLVESGGDPQARSPIGARGLMQVMPQTAARIASERGLEHHTEDKLDDPAYNLDLGAWFLARQLEEFGGDRPSDEAIALAAAAYNAGPARLRAALRGDAELSDETKRYRSTVAALWSERQLPQSSLVGE